MFTLKFSFFCQLQVVIQPNGFIFHIYALFTEHGQLIAEGAECEITVNQCICSLWGYPPETCRFDQCHYSLPHVHSNFKDYLPSSYLSPRAWSLLELIFFPGWYFKTLWLIISHYCLLRFSFIWHIFIECLLSLGRPRFTGRHEDIVLVGFAAESVKARGRNTISCYSNHCLPVHIAQLQMCFQQQHKKH